MCAARAHGSLSPKISVPCRSNADRIHACTAKNRAVLRRGCSFGEGQGLIIFTWKCSRVTGPVRYARSIKGDVNRNTSPWTGGGGEILPAIQPVDWREGL